MGEGRCILNGLYFSLQNCEFVATKSSDGVGIARHSDRRREISLRTASPAGCPMVIVNLLEAVEINQ